MPEGPLLASPLRGPTIPWIGRLRTPLRGSRRRRGVLAVVAATSGGALLFLPLLVPQLPGWKLGTPWSGSAGVDPGARPPPASSTPCNPVRTPTPSALLIPAPNPNGSLSSGGQLNVTFEVEISGASGRQLG